MAEGSVAYWVEPKVAKMAVQRVVYLVEMMVG
jgi:hypothetical protein